MARINLRPGDSGDLPVTFAGDTIQQAVTFQNAGTITLSTTGCSVYVTDVATGKDIAKIISGRAPIPIVVARNQLLDVLVAGTTAAAPSGVIHYSFA